MKRKTFVKTLALGLLGTTGPLASMAARADSKYPERPVTLIVPFSAGGGTDATMRAFAKAFQDVTGQPMLIENKPGAGSMVALGYLKGKPADGYTLMTMTTSPFTQYWVNGGKGPVQPLADFDYLVGTHGSIFALLARADAPYDSLEDAVKFFKANPGRPVSFGNIGTGSAHNLLALEFAKAAGINAQHVSFKGEADSNTAALGGHIDLTASSGSFVPLVEGKRLKVLALATPDRLTGFPQWKTFRQQGYDIVLSTQVGIGAPKGIAPQLASRIDAIVREVVRNPDFVATAQRLYQPVQFVGLGDYAKVAQQQFQTQEALMARHKLTVE